MKEYSNNMEVAQIQENNDTAEKTEIIPPEPSKKHPLEHKWTLWFYESNRKNDWLENLHNVYTFDTVEDFWCLYNHIRPVNSLGMGNDYALFKDGVKPIWEDPRNNKGGRWLVTLDMRHKNVLSDLWLNLLLFMIGESFDECSDEICGAYINIRKHDKINLWTSDATKIKEIENIGKKLKFECLNLKDLSFTYDSHEEAQRKGSREKPPFLFV